MKHGSLFLLFLLLNVSAIGQENTNTSQPQTILLCDQIEDGELKVVCEQFHQALLEKRLLSPAGAAAYDQFKKLEKADPLPGLVLALRIKLTSALQQELRQALDVASRLSIDQTATQLIYNRDFAEYQAFAQKIAELSGEEGEESAEWKWQEIYFEALEQRENARRIDSRDTSLLIPVLETLVEALKVSNDQAHLYQGIAELLLEIKNYNQARTFFIKANARAPEWATPVIGLSNYLAELDEEEQALALADQAVTIQTDFAETYLNAARLSAQFEKPEKSITYYMQAIDKLMMDIASGSEAFKWYDAFRLSKLLVQFELYEQAEVFLKKILAKKEVAEAYLLLGQVYENNNRALSADSVYRRCIALWPDHIGGYLRGGLLFQGIGRYDLAKPFFEKAYVLNPGHRNVCFNLGSLRHLFSQSEDAELLYKQALAFPEGFKPVHDKMGDLLKKMESNSQSTQMTLLSALNDPEAYFQANFAFPGPPISSYEDFIYANLGDLYHQQGRTDEAIEMYQNALLLNPGLQEVYKNLIQSYYDKKDFEKAMTYIQLYQLYVPYSRETKEDWKIMGQTAREISQKKISKKSDQELNIYTFFMDNFWSYLNGINQENKSLNLDRTLILRQQRPILQQLKKANLEDQLK